MADAMALTFLQQQQQPQQAQPAPNSNAVALSDARPDQSLLLPPDRRRKGRTGTFPQKLHQVSVVYEARFLLSTCCSLYIRLFRTLTHPIL
jgi:hypothetical protein